MDYKTFLGTWKVSRVITSSGPESILESVKFCLDEAGDVTFWINDSMPGSWDNPVQSKKPLLPLLECDSYEINMLEGLEHIEFIKEEKVVSEFVINEKISNDNFVMTSTGTSCTLYCVRLPAELRSQQISEHPFSFITALHEEFFSDVTISSDDNKQIKAHSVILKLTGLCGDTNRFISLDGLSEPLLKTILHWGYANCLHPDINMEICQEIIKLGESAPVLTSLVECCKIFISNMELKQRLESFVSDMHLCLRQCVNHITCNESRSPVQLCHAFKNGFKEIAIAGAHFLEFCLHLKVQCRYLNSTDRHEILRYAYSLFPTFVKLLYETLKGAWDSFRKLSPSQKQELAQYVIPEIEGFLNCFTSVFAQAKLAVEKIIEVVDAESTSDSANRSKVILRNKCDYGYNELTILKILHSKITYLMLYAVDKRECFSEMNQNEKLRSISHNFDMISEEFPLFILRLQEVIASIDDKYDAYEFNFGFKLTTTTVAGILQRAITHSDFSEKLIEQMCAIIQRDRFTQIMKSLGILKSKTQTAASCDSTENVRFPNDTKSSWTGSRSDLQTDLNFHLNLGESLYSSPGPERSMLARKATKLLYSEKYTDMEFIIIPTSEEKSSAQASGTEPLESVNKTDSTVIQAHRVIVAARCPWFRRALLSGMIEDRNRKIVIYDTSPIVFKEFLHYLYGNGISQSCISNQDYLAELMLLADRYELDELKKITEFILITGVDDDSAIYLLSIADQINADELKSTCLEYIAINQKLLNNDLFTKLPEDLQNETKEFVTWKTPSHKPNKYRERIPRPPPPPRCPQSPNTTLRSHMSERDSFGDLEEMMLHGDHSSLLSLDSLSHDSDEQLESCLSLFRDIVGPGPSNECLVRMILAADYDVNRAVNFYYSEHNV